MSGYRETDFRTRLWVRADAEVCWNGFCSLTHSQETVMIATHPFREHPFGNALAVVSDTDDEPSPAEDDPDTNDGSIRVTLGIDQRLAHDGDDLAADVPMKLANTTFYQHPDALIVRKDILDDFVDE